MGKSICFVALNIYPLLKKTSFKVIGGAEVEQKLIGKELDKRGYFVSYVTLDHGQGMVSKIDSFHIFSTFKPAEGIPGLRFFYPRLVKIWQALNRTNADIYFVQCADRILGIIVFWARLNNKKVIYRGAMDSDFDPKNLPLEYYKDKVMFFWGLKRCTDIVVQNSYQKSLLNKNFSRDSVIIHNGMGRYDGENTSKDIILWVANIKTKKDPKAFIELAKQLPDENFVMVGGEVVGHEDLYEHVTRESENLPNLNFRGFLPLEETEKEFDRAKIFVNTSLFEGFPNTYLQAWRQGTPVITFIDPDGLIAKHSLGRIPIDKADMANIVKSILNRKDEFNSEKIKKYFDENMAIEIQVDKYEDMFKLLLKNYDQKN